MVVVMAVIVVVVVIVVMAVVVVVMLMIMVMPEAVEVFHVMVMAVMGLVEDHVKVTAVNPRLFHPGNLHPESLRRDG